MPKKVNMSINITNGTIITKSDGRLAKFSEDTTGISDIDGMSASNIKVKKWHYSDTDFINFEIASTLNNTLCVVPTAQLLVLDKKKNSICVTQARDIAVGDLVLEPVPKPYTYNDVIDADTLNELAVSTFVKNSETNVTNNMENKYANLFKKSPKLTVEALMFLGMVYANGRNVIKNERRRMTSCTVNVPSPTSEAAKCFINKALNDLDIEFPVTTYEKNRSSDLTERLQSGSKKTYILMRYIFGDDNDGDKNLSKLLHISPDHDSALLYGIVSTKTTISDRSHEKRADEAFINCHSEQMLIHLYTLMMLNGIRPTPHIKIKKNGNVAFRYTTTSDVIKRMSGMPMTFDDVRTLIDKSTSDFEQTGRVIFLENSDGTRFLTHRIDTITELNGDIVCMKPMGTNGYVVNNIGIYDGRIVVDYKTT